MNIVTSLLWKLELAVLKWFFLFCVMIYAIINYVYLYAIFTPRKLLIEIYYWVSEKSLQNLTRIGVVYIEYYFHIITHLFNIFPTWVWLAPYNYCFCRNERLIKHWKTISQILTTNNLMIKRTNGWCQWLKKWCCNNG